MNFKQLEAFQAIMLSGSTTGAAERMGLSQPAISRLLAQLEEDLALRLFVREKGRLSPTAEAHALLAKLGPEPLTDAFSADYLRERAKGRSTAIKQFLMDNQVVVGVGNIYANEALYAAGIHPKRAAGNISAERLGTLVAEIKRVLAEAIRQGGTTLKDFTSADGKPGYFVQQLQVYGRGGQPCFHCQTLLSEVKIGQRTTVFCSHCQR